MASQASKPVITQPVKGTQSQARSAKAKVSGTNHTPHFVFEKGNYRVFFIAMALVLIGFITMTGTTDIYDTRKIVIAPLLVLSGFVVGFFAIFKKPANKA
ncbi:DUF3098 domain-containing protein [Mucilaginibacter sp. AW1-3]